MKKILMVILCCLLGCHSAPTKELEEPAPSPVAQQNRITRTKSLAIFPYIFPTKNIQYGQSVTGYANTQRGAKSAFKDIVFEEAGLAPVYSYYEVNERYECKKIDINIIDENTIETLWSGEKPKIDNVMALAKRLNVDAVFLSNCQFQDIDMYIVDVEASKVYHRGRPFKDTTGYYSVPQYIKEFFKNTKITD